jgi:alkylated DNA repair dioxygenase AlkB
MSTHIAAAVPHDPVIAEAFARQGHVMITNMLPKGDVQRAWEQMARRGEAGTLTADTTLGTTIPAAYGDPVLDELMNALIPRVEYCTGLALFPTYTFARIYKRGDQLKPHRDRRACEISLSINLGQIPDKPWALCVEGRDKVQASALLNPGDALIYRGIELTHWREPYEGEQTVQTFMHYVDQNGPNAGERFDGRPALGTPEVR